MSQVIDNQHSKNTNRQGISLELLWVLVIISGYLFFISLIPHPPNDLWWPLKIGELIYNTHTIPTTNMFAWTIPPDQPFFYGAWLGELTMCVLYHIGNLRLLIAIRTLLIGISVWLIASEAHRRSGSWRISAFVISILGLMTLSNTILRTQILAWLLFVITYIVLQRYSEGKLQWHWIILCPICMIFWVNIHGSFILGLILIAIFIVGEALRRLFKQSDALNWHQIGWIGCNGIMSGLAILVNPRFVGIINYEYSILTNQTSQKLILEWKSPTPQGIAHIAFYLSILLFIIILAYSKYRPTPTEILLSVLFMWLSWSGLRYIIWYGMIITPILARLIKDLPIKMPIFVPQKNWLNLILAIILFIPAILVQPWFVERMPLPDSYWQQVLHNSEVGPLLDLHTPVKATEYLRSHPGGNLFNDTGYGSYLIWAFPEQGVFVDPRVDYFPYSLWIDYYQISDGINYNELFKKYGVDRIFLDKTFQQKLAILLAKDHLWNLEYEDEYAQIWSTALTPTK